MTARTEPQRVAVVGAGVLGASIAAALVRDGVRATVIAQDAGGRAPVSRASLAWVNARAKTPDALRLLNEDARRVHAELASPWFSPTGAVADGEPFAEDGWVDTAACIAAQLAAVDDVRTATLDGLDALREEFDAVVVAAGAGTAALVPGSPRLVTTTGATGYLARIRVDDSPVDRIHSVAGLQLRPDGDGMLAAQSLRIEQDLRDSGVAITVDAVWPALRDEIEAALGWAPPVDAPITIDVAARTHPVDGLPVTGWVGEGVYAAVAHSGVTLAPLLADLVARDLRGDADPRLAPFRP